MFLRGRLVAKGEAYLKVPALITFAVEDPDMDALNAFNDKDMLDIEFDKTRPIRSNQANRMMWAVLKQIADKIHSDKDSVYLEMLRKYGTFTFLIVKKDAVEKVKKGWREAEVYGDIKVGNMEAVQLRCYYGTHLMDTKEFSVFLDHVLDEAKALGIESKETARMRDLLEKVEKRAD